MDLKRSEEIEGRAQTGAGGAPHIIPAGGDSLRRLLASCAPARARGLLTCRNDRSASATTCSVRDRDANLINQQPSVDPELEEGGPYLLATRYA